MMEDNYSASELDFQPSVLIVDDIAENLQVLGNILDEQDIEFSYASNGKEALEAVLFHKPDLILLDVNMPGMSGFEVCKKLKKNPSTKNIPVIFITAKNEPEDIQMGFTVGGVDYILKPFNPIELISRVTCQLDLSKSRHTINSQIEELKRLNINLEESLDSKYKFFSIIAHDLKGPFHSLIGFSDLILRDYGNRSPEDIKRKVRIINDTSRKSFEVLNNLLEWSRSQVGSIKYSPKKIQLYSLVKDVLVLLNAAAEEKEIQLKTEIPSEFVVFADENMIHTVIRNLVSNALKFTKPGGEVNIVCRKSGQEAEILVRDTGIGIKEEDFHRLFSLTNKYSIPGTEGERGIGLGLLLCKEFVEKNGGEISINSEFGKGSEFSFRIPIHSDILD